MVSGAVASSVGALLRHTRSLAIISGRPMERTYWPGACWDLEFLLRDSRMFSEYSDLSLSRPRPGWFLYAALYLIRMIGACRRGRVAAPAYILHFDLFPGSAVYVSATQIFMSPRGKWLVWFVSVPPPSPQTPTPVLRSLPVLAVDVRMRPQRECTGPGPHPSQLLCLWLLCGPGESCPNSTK